jgi:hypothetical protein
LRPGEQVVGEGADDDGLDLGTTTSDLLGTCIADVSKIAYATATVSRLQ